MPSSLSSSSCTPPLSPTAFFINNYHHYNIHKIPIINICFHVTQFLLLISQIHTVSITSRKCISLHLALRPWPYTGSKTPSSTEPFITLYHWPSITAPHIPGKATRHQVNWTFHKPWHWTPVHTSDTIHMNICHSLCHYYCHICTGQPLYPWPDLCISKLYLNTVSHLILSATDTLSAVKSYLFTCQTIRLQIADGSSMYSGEKNACRCMREPMTL